MKEAQQAEWKESWRDDYLKWICGFANPDLANVFFRSGMIESWGRGIELILEECRAAKVPDPKLRYEADGLWVEFAFRPGSVKSSVKGSVKSSVKITGLLKATPQISARQIAERLGLTLRAVEKQLANLKADGAIKRIGPARGGHWEVV